MTNPQRPTRLLFVMTLVTMGALFIGLSYALPPRNVIIPAPARNGPVRRPPEPVPPPAPPAPPPPDPSGIAVTMARIGCLDIQHDGNLTAIVGQACDGKTSCSFKAPTEGAYKREGVHAATKSFCTQGMEITYRCGEEPAKVVRVAGDAWNNPPAQLICPPAGSDMSWRARNGFSFSNTTSLSAALGEWNLGEITSSDVFGNGLLIAQMIFDPATDLMAAEFLGIVNSLPPNGLCFGFDVGALRFAHGDRSFVPDNDLASDPSWDGKNEADGFGESAVHPYTQDQPSSGWFIRGPSLSDHGPAANPSIARYVHRMQLLLGSSETITAFLEDEAAGKNANDLLRQVNSAIASGGVIVMHTGAEGHAVIPTGIVQGPSGYQIVVYNPDNPYERGSRNPDPSDYVTVDTAHNTFDFEGSGGPFHCGLEGINVVPYSILRSATLPYAYVTTGNLGAGLLLAVGSATADVAQISDSHGHNLLKADGTQNTDPATRIARGAEFPSNWGPRTRAKHARLFVLDPRERYTHTVTGTAAGKYSATALGPGFGVSFQASSAPGEQDTIVVDKTGATPSAEFRTSAARKDVEAHVSILAADRSSRQIKVNGAGARGAPLKIGFDPTGDTITFEHGGPAAGMAITLMSRGAGGVAGPKFPVANVAVRTGDVVTIKPNWKTPGAGSMHVKSLDGTERTNGL